MNCEREDELLDALGRGYVPPELARHAAACASCSELHLVAAALLDERAGAAAEASLPSAGTMLWRMQMRRRREAEAAARRSMLVVQAATLAVAAVLLAALFGVEVVAGVRYVIATLRVSTPIVIAVATWIVLAPIAGYALVRQK